MSDDEQTRYEINHDGEIVKGIAALSEKLDELVKQLFSQNGWSYYEKTRQSSYRSVTVKSPIGEQYDINLFTANIRNEKRSPYEKKIQLNKEDPRQYKNGVTLILGFYVYQVDDDIKDAIIVGYPIVDSISYGTNPSLRGTFVNDILHKAKIYGMYVDGARNIVGFRPEFIFYYLKNYVRIHGYKVIKPKQATGNIEDIIKFPHNRIIFGAPGTGKSYKLENERSAFGDNYERVTFHPNYSYAQFVGTYKPVPCDDSDGITYEYVPGPFMRILGKAKDSMKNSVPKPFLLIIEEINRANMAAVFGDVFQLLDRKDGISEYEIETSADMRKYLQKEYGGELSEYEKIGIPNNMYIWATMNSADQGVFPMDTAFKRRWAFEYIGINKNASIIQDIKVLVGEDKHCVKWDELRRGINAILSEQCKINEDKLLGPFFISDEVLIVDKDTNMVKDNERFLKTFKTKVLMYLYEDAGKQYKSTIFSGCDDYSTYSLVCEEFDIKGEKIFGDEIGVEKQEKSTKE